MLTSPMIVTNSNELKISMQVGRHNLIDHLEFFKGLLRLLEYQSFILS